MADNDPVRQMSLVPYSNDNQEILLQRDGAVVVYDNQSHQLSVQHKKDQAIGLLECPLCHRPLPDNIRGEEQQYDNQYEGNHSFVDPDYFGMLAQSQRASPNASNIGTPHLRPRRHLRSGRSRDVSGSQPAGEFVASAPADNGQGISSSAFSPGYFKQFFREERELGRGGNGVVLLVEHVLDGVSLGHFACKRIPVGDDHKWLEKVLIEVKLLAQVPHQNLVKYHWVWVEKHKPASFGPSVPCVWILQEYCNGGDLHNYVLGPREAMNTAEKLKARHRKHSRGDITPPVDLRTSNLTLEEIFTFFKDITSGLHHLHSKGYIHRDVKPSNCLLQHSEGRTRVLLSDFGEVQAAGTRRGNTGATGTISYCAPEVLRRDRNDNFGNFTTKSDIFSLGMIVFFMCFGRLPYMNADIDEENEDLELLREEISAWQGFDDLTGSRKDLPDRLYKYLQRLLALDPNERPSTGDILASIRASTGFADTSDPRVTPVDSPQKSTLPRRNSYFQRSVSPSKAKGDSTSTSIDASRLLIRTRTIDTSTSPPPQQSPRLMLPPPPEHETFQSRILRAIEHIRVEYWIKSLICIVKLITLLLSNAPYLPDTFMLIFLLSIAVLELGFEHFDLRRTSILALVHVLSLWYFVIEPNRRIEIGSP